MSVEQNYETISLINHINQKCPVLREGTWLGTFPVVSCWLILQLVVQCHSITENFQLSSEEGNKVFTSPWCPDDSSNVASGAKHHVMRRVFILSSKQYAGRKEGGCWWLSNIQTRVVTTIEWRWYQHLLILTVTTPILPHIDDIRIDTMDNVRVDTTQVDPAFDETHDWSCCILMLRLSTSHYHSDAVMMLQLGTTTARCSYIWWNLEKRLMSLSFTQCYSSGLIHWVTIWEVIVVLNHWPYIHGLPSYMLAYSLDLFLNAMYSRLQLGLIFNILLLHVNDVELLERSGKWRFEIWAKIGATELPQYTYQL